MDRCWLLTWTTYGTWLPGDARGSVTRVREGTSTSASRERRSVDARPGLVFASLEQAKGDAVLLDREQATIVARQLEESARFRGWTLCAGSVMGNHVHVVLGVADDPSPGKLLQVLKSYASRALNAKCNRSPSGAWWTSGGSTRKLADDAAVFAAVRYVRDQAFVLARCSCVAPADSANRARGTSVPRWPGNEGVIEEGSLQ